MMAALLASVAAVALQVPPPVRPPLPATHPVVDGFIADLSAGRRDAAIAAIDRRMDSVSTRPNAAATAPAMVDILLRCRFLSYRPAPNYIGLYRVEWRCPDGVYEALIDPDWSRPQLKVGQFQSRATLEAWRREPLRPPAPTPPRPAR